MKGPPLVMRNIEQALRTVIDPEMGENIVDLGLIDSVDYEAARIHVTLVPTSATCPMSEVLLDDVTKAVQNVCPATCKVSASLNWDRTWHPSRMSPALQRRFGWESGQE